MYKEVEVLEDGGWSTSYRGRFIPGEAVPGIHWIGGWVSPGNGLDAVAKRNSCPCREWNPAEPFRYTGNPIYWTAWILLYRDFSREFQFESARNCTCLVIMCITSMCGLVAVLWLKGSGNSYLHFERPFRIRFKETAGSCVHGQLL